MEQRTDHAKGTSYERLMCKAYGFRYSNGQRPDITHAYRNLLFLMGGMRLPGMKEEKQFAIVIKHLKGAIAKFQKRNKDASKVGMLDEIAATVNYASCEGNIEWAVDALQQLMPIE